MTIFLIALLALSLVAFIAFLFSKSRTKKRNLLLSGIIAIASLVTLGVVNAQSNNNDPDNAEPKSESTTSKKDKTSNSKKSTNDAINESTDKSTPQNSSTNNDNQKNSNNIAENNQNNNSKPSYRSATYELDKLIANTTSIGNSTMTLEAYNSFVLNQTTLNQVIATYGIPSNTSSGTQGSTTIEVFYPTNQTNYSVDLKFNKTSSNTWILNTKNSIKTTGIVAPGYNRQ